MAIKLDGHTITELKLKASDGSEVTKQLTEEGTIPTPTETLDVHVNGLIDVTNYKKVNVQVEGGGELPELTNPASAADIAKDKESIDGSGNKIIGTNTFDADTSDADAIASDIAEGKTAYVNGVKVTGTASGGGGGYELLKTVTVDTAARKIDFVWETDWEQYDAFLVACNATLSAADYLYFGFAPSSTSSCTYINKSVSSFNGFADVSFFNPIYNKNTGELYRLISDANSPKVYVGFASGGTASLFAYNASNTIQTGSVFKIYGAKFPTA